MRQSWGQVKNPCQDLCDWLHNTKWVTAQAAWIGLLFKSRKSPEAGLSGAQRCVAKCHHPWEGAQRQLPGDRPLFKGLRELQGLGAPVSEKHLEPGKGWRRERREVRQFTCGARGKILTAGRCSLWFFMHAFCYPLAPDGIWNTRFCQPLGGSPTILFCALIIPPKRDACLIRLPVSLDGPGFRILILKRGLNGSRSSEESPRTLGCWLSFPEMLYDVKSYLLEDPTRWRNQGRLRSQASLPKSHCDERLQLEQLKNRIIDFS